jgi:regulator of protease activity HflC (stomatin/prohibitin superfamily)
MTQVTWQVFVAMLLVIVTVIALLIRATSKNPAGRTRALRIAAVAGGLAIFVLILGSTTIVSTRNIGVVTTFGRPGATLSNGLHIKAPWQSVTEMNGTIQIDNHTGEAATTVRLGNNSTANVDNSVRWRIQPAAADELFLDYREFDNVRDNLVTRELKAALNEVFSDFDPLAPENSEGANVQALGDQVAEKLRTKVGGQIEIINVIVPLVNYDQATQDRINALNVEKANTRVAEQRAKTAEAEARANGILAASVTNDPNVLVSKCLDAAREAHISPLGCWPNTTVVPTVPAR